MGLQFILGAATADHEAAIKAGIAEVLATDHDAQVFYLVPNHVKYEAEVSLLKQLRGQAEASAYAQSQVQTLSLQRLAWYFLKDQPTYALPQLDRASNTMLVARLLAEHQDALLVYGREQNRPGFVAELAEQLSELQTGRITSAMLKAIVEDLPKGDRHRGKFADLALMLAAYEEAVASQHFATTASLLSALQAELTRQDLSHTYVYLNHFNELAAVELSLVETLMTHAQAVTVALIKPAEQDAALFVPATRLHQRLLASAKRLQVPIHPALAAPKRRVSTTMHQVAAFFETDRVNVGGVEHAHLELASASDPYVELRTVAQRISQAVHHGARYRDFLVIARHLTPYQDLIAPIFNEYRLPYFTDLEHPMQHHPLVVVLDALFAIDREHYQVQDVMRLLRTGLVRPRNVDEATFMAAVDVVDNHLLRTGLSGNYWLQQADWQYFRRTSDENDTATQDETKTAQINLVRHFVLEWLPPLFQKLRQAQTGQAAATALYQWLVAVGVQDQLATWRQTAIDEGDLTASQAGEQAWGTFVDLLDDYVTILGASTFDRDLFEALLAAGFAGATYTQIPSTLDQVTISETALTRLAKYRHVFVIGATSSVMPDVPKDTAVLTSADRAYLQPFLPTTAFLPLQGPQTTLGDAFINYTAILAADTKLTMSFPAFGEGKNLPSPYLTGLQAACKRPALTQWQPPQLTTPIASVAGTARSLLSDFVVVARLAQDQDHALGAGWQQVLAAIKTQPDLRALAFRLSGSLHYQNAVGKLHPDLAQQLYHKQLNVSVSRLEAFYRNPYEYFLRYGLRLTKRPEFELTPADTGALTHAVLDQVQKTLLAQGQQLVDLAPEALAQHVRAAVSTFSQQPGYEILTSTAYMSHVQTQLETLLTSVLTAMQTQQRHGQFRVQQTELLFGQIGAKQGLPPLVLPPDDPHGVIVRGKIDRLDVATVGHQDYFVVVDYKSSARQFDPEQAYYGLALQMLTYLDAVSLATPQSLPAGALYFHLHTPRLKYQPTLDVAQAALADYRFNGLVVLPADDQQALAVVDLFDRTLQTTPGKSVVVPLATKKDGTLGANAKVLSQAALALYLAHNRRKIVEAAAKIQAGVIDLAPIQFKQEADTITQSDYQAVMLFDPATGFDHYHHVASLTKDAVLTKLKEEADGD